MIAMQAEESPHTKPAITHKAQRQVMEKMLKRMKKEAHSRQVWPTTYKLHLRFQQNLRKKGTDGTCYYTCIQLVKFRVVFRVLRALHNSFPPQGKPERGHTVHVTHVIRRSMSLVSSAHKFITAFTRQPLLCVIRKSTNGNMIGKEMNYNMPFRSALLCMLRF